VSLNVTVTFTWLPKVVGMLMSHSRGVGLFVHAPQAPNVNPLAPTSSATSAAVPEVGKQNCSLHSSGPFSMCTVHGPVSVPARERVQSIPVAPTWPAPTMFTVKSPLANACPAESAIATMDDAAASDQRDRARSAIFRP
jgi:hypothetical protein